MTDTQTPDLDALERLLASTKKAEADYSARCRLEAAALVALPWLIAQARDAAEWRKHHCERRITTPCPSCGHASLFIAVGGHLTCSWLKCKEPGAERAVADLRDARDKAIRRAERAEQEKVSDIVACISDDIRETCRALSRRAESAEADMATADARAEQADAAVTDWMLVADGVKHDPRCDGETEPLCLRCRREELQREHKEACVAMNAENDRHIDRVRKLERIEAALRRDCAGLRDARGAAHARIKELEAELAQAQEKAKGDVESWREAASEEAWTSLSLKEELDAAREALRSAQAQLAAIKEACETSRLQGYLDATPLECVQKQVSVAIWRGARLSEASSRVIELEALVKAVRAERDHHEGIAGEYARHLAEVDRALAFRPALEKYTTRGAKIEAACAAAQKAEDRCAVLEQCNETQYRRLVAAEKAAAGHCRRSGELAGDARRLRTALLAYGNHHETCEGVGAFYGIKPCTCGLFAALGRPAVATVASAACSCVPGQVCIRCPIHNPSGKWDDETEASDGV